MPSPALDQWRATLRGLRHSMHFKLAAAVAAAAAADAADDADARVWAVDLSRGAGGSAPKFYVVATPSAFAAAYVRVPAWSRHAYEIIEATRGCHFFFDLDAAARSADDVELLEEACADVAAAAVLELRQLAAAGAPLRVEVLQLTASRPPSDSASGKVSRHLLLQAALHGRQALLAGPRAAGALAQRVQRRLLDEKCAAAAGLIDLAVYGDRRAFRLLGSTKLADARSRPLEALCGGGAAVALSATDVLASLVAPPASADGPPPLLLRSPAAPAAPPLAAAPPPAAAPSAKQPRLEEPEKPPPPPSQPVPTAAGVPRRWWGWQTEQPLLDMPRLPHPAVAARASGDAVHAPPPPLQALLVWAAARLRALGAGRASRWRYERAESPREAYVHVTGEAQGVCAHVGRAHASQRVMVTIDLERGVAWQRCWDQRCTVVIGSGYVKAKHALGAVPADVMPSAEGLHGFEQSLCAVGREMAS